MTTTPITSAPIWSRLTSSLLTLIVAAVLPVAAGLAILVVLIEAEIRDSKEEEMLGVVHALGASVDAELNAASRFAEALASTENVLRGDFARFHSGIRRMLATQPQLTSIAVTDLVTGTYLAHTALPPGTTGPAGAVAIEQSRIVAATGKTTIFGVRPSGPTVADPIIPIRAPIFRDGQVTQTLTVTLSPAYLSSIYRKNNFDSERTGAIIDPELRIAARNRSSEQYVGKKITPQLESGLRDNSSGIFESVNQEGQRVYTVFSRSAETGWISVGGLPAAEIDGAVWHVIVPLIFGSVLACAIGIGIAAYIAVRIRRAREAEQQIKQSLEHLVDERTAALRESTHQLHEVQKMEAIGKLTGGMAHDFNNYLGVIIGNLELLKEAENMDAAKMKLADAALNGAWRGAELTRSLLAFSRRQPLNPRLTDVSQRLEAIASLLKRTLGEDITLRTQLTLDLWPVRIDGAQLDSCIVNLANNARDAMPRGGSLAIETRNIHLDEAYAKANAEVAAGEYVLITVSDSGTGMPEETLERAFEPFFTTKGPGHGTGLGLSMVFGFVKQSGGHTQIYSEVGHGTTVRIYLPRADVPTDAKSFAVPAIVDETAARGSGTVLLVEDNEEMRQTAVAQLTSLGYRVIGTENGGAALAVLERRDLHLDLLFSDVVMPGKPDGYELAEFALERRSGIKILLTSGFPGDVLQRHGVPMAKFNLLRKPYTKDELARAVKAALSATLIPVDSV